MKQLTTVLVLASVSMCTTHYASSLAPSTPADPPTMDAVVAPHPAMTMTLPIKNDNELTFTTNLCVDYSIFDNGIGPIAVSGATPRPPDPTTNEKPKPGTTVFLHDTLGYVGFKTGVSLMHQQNGGVSLDYRYIIAKNMPRRGASLDGSLIAGVPFNPMFADAYKANSFTGNWNLLSGHDFDFRLVLPNISPNSRLTFTPFLSLFCQFYDQELNLEYEPASSADLPWRAIRHTQYTEGTGPGLGMNMFYSLLAKPRQIMGFRAGVAYNPLSVTYLIGRQHMYFRPNVEKSVTDQADIKDNFVKLKSCLRTMLEFGYAHTPPTEHTYTYTALGIDNAIFFNYQEAFGLSSVVYSPRNFTRQSIIMSFTAGF